MHIAQKKHVQNFGGFGMALMCLTSAEEKRHDAAQTVWQGTTGDTTATQLRRGQS